MSKPPKWTHEMLVALADEVCARAEGRWKAPPPQPPPANVLRFPTERCRKSQRPRCSKET